jgi:hypothetical protein
MPTYNKSAYFEKGEVLARVGVPDVDEVTFSYERGPDAYLRLLTKSLPRPLSLAVLSTAAAQAPLLRSSGYGGLTTINKHGALIYDPAGAHRGGPAPIHFVTQLFQSGELWCTSDSLIVRERGWRPPNIPIPLIPTLVMEQTFYRTLHAAVPFAVQNMALTFPALVEFGLLDLQGVQITVPAEETWGPIQAEDVVLRAQGATLLDCFSIFPCGTANASGFAHPGGIPRMKWMPRAGVASRLLSGKPRPGGSSPGRA